MGAVYGNGRDGISGDGAGWTSGRDGANGNTGNNEGSTLRTTDLQARGEGPPYIEVVKR